MTDPVLDSAISLVTPFVAYLAAEQIHGSGVLAVVIAGLLLGHKAPVLQTAQSRIADRMNWRTIAFLLENAVFLLIGLQCRWILDDVRDSGTPIGRIVLVCAAALVGVVVLRFVWVFVARWTLVRGVPPARGATPSSSAGPGMRGVVSLAAAFVIPAGTDYREVLLLVAFTVVAGTLLAAGPDPAVAGAPARRRRAPTRPRMRWPGPRCSSRRPGPAWRCSTRVSTTTRTVSPT